MGGIDYTVETVEDGSLRVLNEREARRYLDPRFALGFRALSRGLAGLFICAALLGCAADSQTASHDSTFASNANTGASHQSSAAFQRSRWVGVGRHGGCNLSWAVDLIQERDRITGRLILEDIEYEIHGIVDSDGSMYDVRGGKSAASKGVLGPRFIRLSVDFGDLQATGKYAVETSDSNDCATEFELNRYAAD